MQQGCASTDWHPQWQCKKRQQTCVCAHQVSDLPARELVPGDVVELSAGDKVPADMRLVVLKTATLRAEQASLTGEPAAMMKVLEPIADKNCELQVRCSSLVLGQWLTYVVLQLLFACMA